MDQSGVPPIQDTRRRRFQFSLRQLLVFTLVVAFLLGFHIWWYPYSMFGLGGLLCSAPLTMVFFRLFGDKSSRVFEWVVVNTIIYVLGTMLASGCVDPRGPARQCQCADQLKQIAIALHSYHDRYGSFPPAYVADAQGRPMHSWRVLILPFLDENALYEQYRFDEPWDGPHNQQLAARAPRAFQSPEAWRSGTPATSYVAVVGSETAWPGSTGRPLSEFSDGTSRTILVVEVADVGISWLEPRDLEFSALPLAIQPENGRGISSLHRDDSWWHRFAGAHVALADGSVVCLGAPTPAATIRALLTVAGGEDVEARSD